MTRLVFSVGEQQIQFLTVIRILQYGGINYDIVIHLHATFNYTKISF